jgi:pSer/pThr/pTyr-binding forkhead associated (FHA) protein
MNHPSLNSVHLHSLPRRDDYRRARDVLLRARGDQTVIAERAARLAEQATAAPRTKAELSATGQRTRYFLKDGETLRPLKIGMNIIGRFPDSDMVLSEAHMSRRHCAVVVHAASGCELHDLASKNGTYLNGQRLTHPVWLVAGDQLRLCDRVFTFVTDQEAQPAGSDSQTSVTLAD